MTFHLHKCLKQIGVNDIHTFNLAENTDAKMQIILSKPRVFWITDIRKPSYSNTYLLNACYKQI